MSIEHRYSRFTCAYLSIIDLNPFLYIHEEFVCMYMHMYTQICLNNTEGVFGFEIFFLPYIQSTSSQCSIQIKTRFFNILKIMNLRTAV